MGKSKEQSPGVEAADPVEPQSGVAGLALEEALERLEATAQRLEQGDLPLEDALELFESGVALTRQCTATLETAERRIEVLTADREGAGAPGVEPFETPLAEDGDDDVVVEDEEDDFDEV